MGTIAEPILFFTLDIEIYVTDSSEKHFVGRPVRLQDFLSHIERVEKKSIRSSLYQKENNVLEYKTERGQFIEGHELVPDNRGQVYA